MYRLIIHHRSCGIHPIKRLVFLFWAQRWISSISQYSQTLIDNPIYHSLLFWLLVGVTQLVSLFLLINVFFRCMQIVNSFLREHSLNPRDWTVLNFLRYLTFDSEIWNISTNGANEVVAPLLRKWFYRHISSPHTFGEPTVVLIILNEFLIWFPHYIIRGVQLVTQLWNLCKRWDRTGEETSVFLLDLKVAVFE